MREHCLELARRTGRDADDLVEWWAERAAVRQFDGGQARPDAERDAFDDLRRALEPTELVAGEARRGPQSASHVETGHAIATKKP